MQKLFVIYHHFITIPPMEVITHTGFLTEDLAWNLIHVFQASSKPPKEGDQATWLRRLKQVLEYTHERL